MRTTTKHTALSTLALALAVLGLLAPAAPAGATTPADALDRLKALEGTWEGNAEAGDEAGAASTRYEVTAGGNVVIETMFPGSDHEMVSVYYLDGDDLVMTHYCASGNHPRLVLDREASTDDTLVFAFAEALNFDPAGGADHVRGGSIRVAGDGSLRESWTFHHGGEAAGSAAMTLTRAGE